MIKILKIECFTAISRGAFQVFSKCLKLSEDNQEALNSFGENATRNALITIDKNIDATFNIAIFSGLFLLAKIGRFCYAKLFSE